MKLVKPTSIAAGIVLLTMVILALVGIMNRANGGVPGGENAALCGTPESQAGTLQKDGPVGAIHAHLCGFHFYNGDMTRQVRADHYCSHLNADVWQCIIYDSDKKNARLIGVEYIISGALFNGLPPEEKKLWHSHRYEVMSGQLIALGLTGDAEMQL